MYSAIKKYSASIISFLILISFIITAFPNNSIASTEGEKLYNKLSTIINSEKEVSLIKKLNIESRRFQWESAKELKFVGNVRHLKSKKTGDFEETNIYLLRKISGEIYILLIPEDRTLLQEGKSSPYSALEKKTGDKLEFNLKVIDSEIDGVKYSFVRFITSPSQLLFDRIFKISIILMLFFVMIGMGLTLTIKDFALVFTKPKGIILGTIMQFGLMPLIAFGIAHLLGYYESYPFIFVGMILITAIPGGVTSNLMTYYAKGDLALSISLTSFSTILSLIFTPLLLGFYCANVPNVTIPIKVVVQTITILVIIPLSIGMFVRSKWEKFAEKSTSVFAILGVIALLFLIIAGLISNIEKFADTERYGFKFYTMVLILTSLGMFFGALFPKIFRINNYQTRAISLETGLRNASLAMAIALLIQDVMGDFHSSMFFVSGIFGLWMYAAGFISIALYKKFLPIQDRPDLVIDSSDEV